MYSTSSFLKKPTGNEHHTWCFDFFHLGYIRDKENTFPKTCTDGLKRTSIRDMLQINLYAFQGVNDYCRHRVNLMLAKKTVNLSIFFKL